MTIVLIKGLRVPRDRGKEKEKRNGALLFAAVVMACAAQAATAGGTEITGDKYGFLQLKYATYLVYLTDGTAEQSMFSIATRKYVTGSELMPATSVTFSELALSGAWTAMDVPEPMSGLLLVGGALLVLRRHRA